MTIDLKETSPTRSTRYLRCRKIQKGKSVKCGQHYYPEDIYAGQLGQLLNILELPAEGVQSLREKLEKLSGEEKHMYKRAKSDIARLQHWIGVLREDSRALVIAAARAQKAADYILRRQREEEALERDEAA